MKKRLRKKLGKLKKTHKRNPGAFFLGEKRIIEQYEILQKLDANHALLGFGEVKEGRFKFKEQIKEPSHAVDYIERLMGAAIELGSLSNR